jgi:hypothetical protein
MAKKGGNDDAAMARADEAARQAKVREGTGQINGIFDSNFTPDYSGNLDSSVRAQKEAELASQYGIQKQGVADQALSYKTQAQNSVEDARANLISTLNATGDAEGAASSALARSSALSAPQAFTPLGSLFGNFTSALGTQAAAERAAALSGGMIQPRYNTGLFGSGGAIKIGN